MRRTASKVNVKEMVTNQIIEALKAGVIPWTKCWTPRHGSARNGHSGHFYRGVNVLLLAMSRHLGGYTSNEWYTFKGAKAKGGSVRKGEKSTHVIFYKKLIREDAEGNVSSFPLLKYYNVFNRCQIDGLPDEVKPEENEHTPDEMATKIVEATGVKISYGFDRACYYPSTDNIEMPALEQFNSASAFHSTEFHEVTHWTGRSTRMDRKGIVDPTMRGSSKYAFEELVAEMGSAFLCAEIGVEGELTHADYIGHWITKLENDTNFIFKASTQAQAACDFILAFSEEQENGKD